MTVIENLPVTNADIPEFLLSCLPIRDSSVVCLVTGLSGKVSGGRRKGGSKKLTVDKIKSLLTNLGSPSQRILTIKLILKDLIYSEQSDQVDIINTKQDSPTIIDIIKKIDKRNKEIVSSDVNTRRRVKLDEDWSRNLVQKILLIKKHFHLVLMVRQEFIILLVDQPNVEPATILLNLLWILVLTKQALTLQCVLSHHCLFKQVSACGYFWKDNKRFHAALNWTIKMRW